jgi:hypothetical protein
MQTYRARSSLIWGWLCVGLGLTFAATDVVGSGLADARLGVGIGACVALVGAAAYLRPAVLIGDDGVVFRNVVGTASAPFARIREVSMRWSLEILGDDGKKAGAFAAPASRGGRTGIFGNDAVGYATVDDREGRPDATGSRLYDAWRSWTDAHEGGADTTTASISRGVDAVGLALLVGAVAALAFAFLG